MKKLAARIMMIVLILALATIACISGGGGDEVGTSGTGGQSINAQATTAAQATATFGAAQFHIQLTAIAEQDK